MVRTPTADASVTLCTCVMRRPIRALFCSVFLVFVSELAMVVLARDTPSLKQKFPIDQENQKNIRFVLSEDALIANVLKQNLTLQARIKPMVSLLKDVVKAIDTRRDRNDINKCNLERIIPNWVYTALLNARYFQIGDLSKSCYSQIHGKKAVEEKFLTRAQVKDSLKDIASGVQALYEASKNAVEVSLKMDSKQWKEKFPLRHWRNVDLPEQCQLETFSAYRIHDDVYIRAAITNHDVDKYVQDGDRQYVMEWVKEDYSTSLKMKQPRLDGMGVNGSTILWKRGARAWLSWHGEMKEDSNPAIQDVLRTNKVEIDLAEDAVAPSNIALLALPLVMSFIPVAFLAELNTCGVLWYIVFTDIISAIPLLIKGIELVGTTNSRQELVAYYAGDKDLADVQVWVAKCSGTNRFKNIGTSFIVIASAATVVGIVLEVCGMIYMRSKSQDGKPALEGPFGKAMFEITAKSVLGTGHGEDWERYSEVMEDTEEVRLSAEGVDDGGDTPEVKRRPWTAAILKFLSPPSQLAHPEEAEQATGGSLTGRDESRGVEPYSAGVGGDGISSAERMEMGLSYNNHKDYPER